MGITEYSEWRHHRKMYRLARSGYGRKNGEFSHKIILGLCVNNEHVRRELHFAYVDHAIRSVKKQVNLRTDRKSLVRRMVPCIRLHMYA